MEDGSTIEHHDTVHLCVVVIENERYNQIERVCNRKFTHNIIIIIIIIIFIKNFALK